ncbi:hypothetical protein [Actinokineospora enzanensis]|uniref:hypothetical protein n=1 Tax=Actinokineospora enzanensis TaxID=155975 RepID=UPI00146D0DB8|nr:hypothetical protein [Actinokineospora enzanensis]
MSSVRMNDVAVAALGRDLCPVDLSPGLRALVAEGIVVHGEHVLFARYADLVVPERYRDDPIGWECDVNSFHLEDVVPVHVEVTDCVPHVGEAEQVVLLRQGFTFAVEIARLADEVSLPVRCIVSVNDTNGTFRFHRHRPGAGWTSDDLDGYADSKVIVVEQD